MYQKKSATVILLLTASLILLTIATNAGPAASAATATLTKIQSGLVVSDSLTTRNTAYWAFYGSAVPENAPYSYYEDTSGLNVGVQAAAEGQWAGYFAESPLTQAELFHAIITLPNATTPSDWANSGLYVQSSAANIDGVACGGNVGPDGYLWNAEYGLGNAYYVTKFVSVYSHLPYPDSPQTLDCTLVTNGQNMLKVFFNNQLVYSSNTLKLQMKSPFNSFLEEQSSYSNALMYGQFKDYYATTSDMVTVTGMKLATTAQVVSTDGTILGSAPVGKNGQAMVEVGQYDMPIAGYVRIVDPKQNVIAISDPTSIWGGDVFGLASTTTSHLTVNTELADGSSLVGMYTVLLQNGKPVASDYSPATFNLKNPLLSTVEVQNSGNLVFDHWLDTGSTSPDRTISITSDTQLTAVYRDTSTPPSSGQSTIYVTTVNSLGKPINGYYTTLWQNNAQLEYCFSPCSFSVNNGQTYSVAVSDYGGETFSHWADGTTSRFYTVVLGMNSTVVSLTAYYKP
ncbi:MAG: hypothetical protein JRN20_11960 [Nitrososphaerota archaeon]|nr:hypothetical protein [Nitrososphaerota archaeon]